MLRVVSFGLLLGLLHSEWALAQSIRKVIREDGRVEYTNVSDDSVAYVTRPPKSGEKGKVTYESIYKYRSDDGVITFTNQKPKGKKAFVTRRYAKFSCYACRPKTSVDWYKTALNTEAYRDHVSASAKEFAVDPALIRAVMHAESHFKKGAVSSQGAQGLMQLMPATAAELGVGNAFDPAENIRGGTKYLSELLTSYKGDITRATAAYNAGPGAVAKYDGVPPYAETQAYVKRVGILYKRYQKAGG